MRVLELDDLVQYLRNLFFSQYGIERMDTQKELVNKPFIYGDL